MYFKASFQIWTIVCFVRGPPDPNRSTRKRNAQNERAPSANLFSDRPQRGRINGGGFLKNCAMAIVLFISAVLKHSFLISQFWGPVPLMRWNTLGATPTAPNMVIEKFPKLCTASSCGLSPKSCSQWQLRNTNGKVHRAVALSVGNFPKSVRNCLRAFVLQCLITCNRNRQLAEEKSPRSFSDVFGLRIGYSSGVLHFFGLLLNKDQTEVC